MIANLLNDSRTRDRSELNGALYSTVGDLARFLAFELGEGPESVLKRATLADIQTRVYSSGPRLGSGYGIGFTLTRRGEHVFLGHLGEVAGYTATLVDPVVALREE